MSLTAMSTESLPRAKAGAGIHVFAGSGNKRHGLCTFTRQDAVSPPAGHS
jgi:hypothetical protein